MYGCVRFSLADTDLCARFGSVTGSAAGQWIRPEYPQLSLLSWQGLSPIRPAFRSQAGVFTSFLYRLSG